jgi:hypothetical protein
METIFQKKFHSVLCEVMEIPPPGPQFETYQSVLSMVYTLIEDDKLYNLDEILRLEFPNYYNSKVPLRILEHEN